MGNEGFLELGLTDAKNQPAHDSDTRVRFFRASDNRTIAQAGNLEFPPIQRFRLPAFPQERNLACEIIPSRFRQSNTGFFTLTDRRVTEKNPIVLRLPSKWTPRFAAWNLLSDEFLTLKDVLEASPDIRVKRGITFDMFVSDTYDTVTDSRAVLAKMALLNLYFALTITKEPTTGTRSWFSFVRQIYLIDRERFIALVDPEMAEIVRAINDDIERFPDYRHTDADNHYEGIRDAVPEGFEVMRPEMFSIKTREEHANIQLTIAPTKDLSGNEVAVLDADIDENGRLLAHLADVIRHRITGGTHPIDIHEFLLLAHPNRNIAFGYELV